MKYITLLLSLFTLILTAQESNKILNDTIKNRMDFGCASPNNEITFNGYETFNNGKKESKLILKERNVLIIELTDKKSIIIEGEYVDLKDVTKVVEDFLDNGGAASNSLDYCKYCKGKRNQGSSDSPNKAYILIGNRNNFDPITLQNYDGFYTQIKNAYNNLCQKLYNNINQTSIKFSDLDCKIKDNFRKKYFPLNIIYIDNYKTNEKHLNFSSTLSLKTIEIVDDKKEVAEGFVKVNKKKIDENTEIPFSVIEKVPSSFGCETITDNQERKKCTSEKIKTFVDKQFDKNITTKLGLTNRLRIRCQFKINVNGEIEDIKVRASHVDLINEATRVIKLMPKFVPGNQDGINVITLYSLPIIINK